MQEKFKIKKAKSNKTTLAKFGVKPRSDNYDGEFTSAAAGSGQKNQGNYA